MNTPLLLTSVALFAGVAARPIENDRQGDDLRELARSPHNDERQAFLGRIPSDFDSLNSLQLHDLHDNILLENSDEANGNASPKLIGTDSYPDPDPGLASPYMGPQRHITSIEQDLGSPALTPDSPTPSSPAARKTGQPRVALAEPDHSPMVVLLVFSSIAALVLLGLTVAVVQVTQLLQKALLRQDVWKSVANGQSREKGDVHWSEKEIGEQRNADSSEAENQGVIATREIPRGRLPDTDVESTKPSERVSDDPDVMPLPELPPSSAPTVRERHYDGTLGLASVGWNYDNWITHFMMALFGWLGVFFGGARDQ